MTTIVLIIALLLGGGTSLAAETAVPGAVLYPVKVGVNEEIRSWLALSNEAQARWDARRAERRLEEAEKLAAKGEFDNKAEASIKARFKEHAKAFEEDTAKIEQKQDSKTAFEVHSDFEAALKAHEQILVKIALKKGITEAEVESLLNDLRIRLTAEVKARNNAEVAVSSETDAKFKAAAEGKLKAALHKIGEVRDFIKAKAETSVEAGAQAEARLKVAEGVIVRGKAELTAGSYGKAFASFQEAMRIAQEAKLMIATENRIDLKDDDRNGDDDKKEASSSASVKGRVEHDNGSTKVEGSGRVKIDLGW